MALIACPECANKVSDAAPSCPTCGVAIAAAAESRASGARLTTTQTTSKKLKAQTLISVALIIVGIFGLFSSANDPAWADNPSLWPGLFLTAGFIWYIVTRVRIWWHHK